MNSDQKIHLEYGGKLLEQKNLARSISETTGGHADKIYGSLLVGAKLNIDPLTGRKVSRPVQAACLWAAEDKERFQEYVLKNPLHKTVRGLHNLYKERNAEDLDPSVYVYRMYGPISGEPLEPGICKIGSADRGAAARVASQSKKAAVGYIPKIELVLKCRNPARLEELLHKKFADRRVCTPGREWFQVFPEDVKEAVQSLERDGELWVDGEWFCIGCKPTKIPEAKEWSRDKISAYEIYKKVLPNIIVGSDDASGLNHFSEETGLASEDVKAGLHWLINKGYLDKQGGGHFTPSEKFYESWGKQKSVKPKL